MAAHADLQTETRIAIRDSHLDVIEREIQAASATGDANHIKQLRDTHGDATYWTVLLRTIGDGDRDLNGNGNENENKNRGNTEGDGDANTQTDGNTDGKSEGFTPLHRAVAAEHKDVVEALLRRQSNGRTQDGQLRLSPCFRFLHARTATRGLTALHLSVVSVLFGRADVLECLVRRQAEGTGKVAISASDRDVEGRSPHEITVEDNLLDLLPTVVKDVPLPHVPGDYDKLFLMDRKKRVHKVVGVDLGKMLLGCTDVKAELGRVQKNLDIYISAHTSILFVAALIASASYSRSLEDFGKYQVALYLFLVFKIPAFLGSVASLLTGATTLRLLGNVSSTAKKVRSVQEALKRVSVLMSLSVLSFIAAFITDNSRQLRGITDTASEDAHGKSFRWVFVGLSAVGVLYCVYVTSSFIRLRGAASYLSSFWKGVVSVTLLGEVLSVLKHIFQYFVGKCVRTVAEGTRIQTEVEKKLGEIRPGYFRRSGRPWDTTEEREKDESHRFGIISKKFISASDPLFAASTLPFSLALFEFVWLIAVSGVYYGLVQFFIRGPIFVPFLPHPILLLIFYASANWSLVKFKSKVSKKILQKYEYRPVQGNVEAGTSKDPTLQLGHEYWVQQNVPIKVIEQFRHFAQDIMNWENVYESLAKDLGGKDKEKVAMAKDFLFCLDRLPHGLFFWFKHSNHLAAKQIPTFYRGYVFCRDLKIFEDLLSRFGRQEKDRHSGDNEPPAALNHPSTVHFGGTSAHADGMERNAERGDRRVAGGSYGKIIVVKYGELSRRFRMDGPLQSINESIKTTFGLHSKRRFWLEDDDGVVQTVSPDMPAGEYTLNIDQGVTVKLCPFEASANTELKTLYSEGDFQDFLSRRRWSGLREVGSFRSRMWTV